MPRVSACLLSPPITPGSRHVTPFSHRKTEAQIDEVTHQGPPAGTCRVDSPQAGVLDSKTYACPRNPGIGVGLCGNISLRMGMGTLSQRQ